MIENLRLDIKSMISKLLANKQLEHLITAINNTSEFAMKTTEIRTVKTNDSVLKQTEQVNQTVLNQTE